MKASEQKNTDLFYEKNLKIQIKNFRISWKKIDALEALWNYKTIYLWHFIDKSNPLWENWINKLNFCFTEKSGK